MVREPEAQIANKMPFKGDQNEIRFSARGVEGSAGREKCCLSELTSDIHIHIAVSSLPFIVDARTADTWLHRLRLSLLFRSEPCHVFCVYALYARPFSCSKGESVQQTVTTNVCCYKDGGHTRSQARWLDCMWCYVFPRHAIHRRPCFQGACQG